MTFGHNSLDDAERAVMYGACYKEYIASPSTEIAAV
jgi:hypothetical protein